MSYDIGDVKKLSLATTGADGKPADPTTVVLSVRQPDGTTATFSLAGSTVIKDSTGLFHVNLPLTEAGVWQYRWNAGGAVVLVEPGALVVGTDPLTEAFVEADFTVGEVWARSPYLQNRYPTGGADQIVDMMVKSVAPLVASMTGREIAGVEGEPVPPSLRELELRALALKAESLDNSFGSYKARKRSISRGNLASFSAGSYSESYFGPQQALAAKQLDPDPVLSEVLWALCTEQRKLEWLNLWDPVNYPLGEGGFVSFEWGNRPNYSTGGWGRRWYWG